MRPLRTAPEQGLTAPSRRLQLDRIPLDGAVLRRILGLAGLVGALGLATLSAAPRQRPAATPAQSAALPVPPAR